MAAELKHQRDGVNAVQDIGRLLALDDLWTSYLDHAGRDDIARDLSDLEALVDDMNRGLAVARDHARVAGDELEKARDEEVTRALDSLLRDQADDWAGLHERFIQGLVQVGVRRSLVVACRYVYLASEEETGFLNAKLARLRRGEFEPGDFSHRTNCLLDLAGVACGAGACVVTFPAGCLALAAGVFRFVRSWDNEGCGDTLAEAFEYVRARGAEPA
jgi:hypothetical protein